MVVKSVRVEMVCYRAKTNSVIVKGSRIYIRFLVQGSMLGSSYYLLSIFMSPVSIFNILILKGPEDFG